jgi:hypothetical protein
MQCARKLLNMMIAMRQLAAGLLCGLMLLSAATGCSRKNEQKQDADQRKDAQMVQNVVLRLGESGDRFVQRIGQKFVKTDKQPAGMNFYKIDWTIYNPGPSVVTFEHGAHTFTIDTVLGVMGSSYEPDINKWGIIDFDISFGLPPRNAIPHEQARLKVMALLRMLQDKGWKQYYSRDGARIKGRSSLRDGDNVDARYVPSFEEWMTLRDGSMWRLQADAVYLNIQMWRDDKHLDPQQPGAYFMSMELHGEEDDVRGYFLHADRDHWRELWPERMKKSYEFRTEAEAEARAKGYQIDTDYQDPPIKALIKPELSSKVGQPCPKDGIWEASRSDSMATTLASYPARWRRFKQGEVMTGFGQGLPGFDDDNQHIIWTWRKPLES